MCEKGDNSKWKIASLDHTSLTLQTPGACHIIVLIDMLRCEMNMVHFNLMPSK